MKRDCYSEGSEGGREGGYCCILSQPVVSRPCSMENSSGGKELSSKTTFWAALVCVCMAHSESRASQEYKSVADIAMSDYLLPTL